MKSTVFPLLSGLFFGVLFLWPTESDAQWVQTNTGLTSTDVHALAVNPSGAGGLNLFAGTNGGVFLSTNNGISWTAINTGLTSTDVLALAVSPNGAGGTNLFAGTNGGVFLSTNNGTSWTPVNTGLSNTYVQAFAVSGTNLFAGTYGVFLSTNNGTNWTLTPLIGDEVTSLAANGNNIFAGTYYDEHYAGSIYLSTDNGTSWTYSLGLGFQSVSSLAINGNNIFAGARGVYLSTDNGTSWTAVNNGLPGNSYVTAFAMSGSDLFAGIYGAGVFLSTNSGTSWTAVNTGLTDTFVSALTVSGTNLFAGTYGGGVWRRPLSEMITSVQQTSDELPKGFALDQNYPNPFNPTTTIRYTLPSFGSTEAKGRDGVGSHVTLKVHDLLGREVATLVNGEMKPGSYETTFDATAVPAGRQGLASGVYFYRLQAGKYVDTKRLLLLR
jgi:hypothetical protein